MNIKGTLCKTCPLSSLQVYFFPSEFSDFGVCSHTVARPPPPPQSKLLFSFSLYLNCGPKCLLLFFLISVVTGWYYLMALWLKWREITEASKEYPNSTKETSSLCKMSDTKNRDNNSRQTYRASKFFKSDINIFHPRLGHNSVGNSITFFPSQFPVSSDGNHQRATSLNLLFLSGSHTLIPWFKLFIQTKLFWLNFLFQAEGAACLTTLFRIVLIETLECNRWSNYAWPKVTSFFAPQNSQLDGLAPPWRSNLAK